jgi:hypothetical protein
MLISTALSLDSIIRNSVCTPAKLPCRRVEVGYEIIIYKFAMWNVKERTQTKRCNKLPWIISKYPRSFKLATSRNATMRTAQTRAKNLENQDQTCRIELSVLIVGILWFKIRLALSRFNFHQVDGFNSRRKCHNLFRKLY